MCGPNGEKKRCLKGREWGSWGGKLFFYAVLVTYSHTYDVSTYSVRQ